MIQMRGKFTISFYQRTLTSKKRIEKFTLLFEINGNSLDDIVVGLMLFFLLF